MQQKSDNIFFIGVPFRSGANREGAQYAPKWLMDQLFLLGNACNLLQFQTEDTPLTDTETEGVKNYAAVLGMIDAVRKEVTSAIGDQKNVVVLGGDHSIAMGSIAGVLEFYQNLGVIWFDAHTDVNTEYSSPSGNAHGMPLAALMGLCKSGINNKGTKLNPANVFWVGARDIDEGEWNIIKNLGIEDHVYTSETVHQKGMKNVMNQIRNQLAVRKVKQLHISFDIDGMDPSIVKATGTPVHNGLNSDALDEFIAQLTIKMPDIISMDFVEYNPLMDDNEHTTGTWCCRALSNLIDILEK